MTLTDREKFVAVCSQRLGEPGDVIVVLCGEDAGPRIEVARHLFESRWAPRILLSGGRDDGERWTGAVRAKGTLTDAGISPDRLLVETLSANTHEQAMGCLTYAYQQGWKRLIIVASSYHCSRAILTFIAELKKRNELETVRLIPAYVSSAWHEPPAGMDEDRLSLLATENRKCGEYALLGHVATYAEGLAYFRHWEGR